MGPSRCYFVRYESFMCVLSIKVPIRKHSGNLFNDPRIYNSVYLSIYLITTRVLDDFNKYFNFPWITWYRYLRVLINMLATKTIHIYFFLSQTISKKKTLLSFVQWIEKRKNTNPNDYVFNFDFPFSTTKKSYLSNPTWQISTLSGSCFDVIDLFHLQFPPRQTFDISIIF